jgi:hypothetical protein
MERMNIENRSTLYAIQQTWAVAEGSQARSVSPPRAGLDSKVYDGCDRHCVLDYETNRQNLTTNAGGRSSRWPIAGGFSSPDLWTQNGYCGTCYFPNPSRYQDSCGYDPAGNKLWMAQFTIPERRTVPPAGW